MEKKKLHMPFRRADDLGDESDWSDPGSSNNGSPVKDNHSPTTAASPVPKAMEKERVVVEEKRSPSPRPMSTASSPRITVSEVPEDVNEEDPMAGLFGDDSSSSGSDADEGHLHVPSGKRPARIIPESLQLQPLEAVVDAADDQVCHLEHIP